MVWILVDEDDSSRRKPGLDVMVGGGQTSDRLLWANEVSFD